MMSCTSIVGHFLPSILITKIVFSSRAYTKRQSKAITCPSDDSIDLKDRYLYRDNFDLF